MVENIEELEKDMTPKLIGNSYMKYATEKSKHRYRYGLFECQYCGKEFETQLNSIKRGITRSCGCQRKGINTTHNLKSHKFYDTWHNIKSRCYNINNKDYKNYGGRGITICDEWLDIKNFTKWTDMTYPHIEGYTLDRIDNSKGYSPNNCRWADAITQAHNKRMPKNNTSGYVGITLNKVTGKWCASVGTGNEDIRLGSYVNKEDAVKARDTYIIRNDLTHKLSTEYVGVV